MDALIQSYNNETSKAVLLACVPFLLLKSKAKFTYRIRPEDDPYSETAQDYQRQLNFQHVKEIKGFLKRVALEPKAIPVFPTAMLIAFTNEGFNISADSNITSIEIPRGCYVVDGQHRLKAMIDLYNEVSSSIKEDDRKIKEFLETYRFNCALLVNYDLWEQAKVFADVNFKQKRVSKSLYYDIYGQEYTDDPAAFKQNGIYLAHSLVEFINNKKYSPLYHQVKMLGSGDGMISQSFFVESLLRHITSPRGIWYFDPYKTTVNSEILTPMKVELISFLQVIKEELKDYWLKSDSILCKTTGIGALMRLMGYIHQRIKGVDLLLKTYDEHNFSEKYAEILKKYIKRIAPKAEELFSSKQSVGKFSNTGGSGMQMALYREMVSLIEPVKEQSLTFDY